MNLLNSLKSCAIQVEVLADFEKRLSLNRPLSIKVGFDPTSADLHLGHTVLINQLKKFQDAGHKVVFLIGDYTARIGDPSGRNIMRKPISGEQIDNNTKTYVNQAAKILDIEKTTIAYNSTWLKEIDFHKILELTSQMTVARMLERDDFSKRYQGNTPISLHEFLYPLMQGYDSVALKADVELGGSDQLFNLMVGRDLQRFYSQPPQTVMTFPLLEGLDGVKKMSKSLDNFIAIDDAPNNMFGKIMSISDDLMWRYFQLLSFKTIKEVEGLKIQVANGGNPRDIKMSLAQEIVARFYDEKTAQKAQQNFIDQFSFNQLPDDIEELTLAMEKPLLANVLKQAQLVCSTSEGLRMINQRAVKIDGEVCEHNLQLSFKTYVIQVGKRRFAKVVIKEGV